jgi:hypothetical protein
MRTPALLSLFLTACPGNNDYPDHVSWECEAVSTTLEFEEVSALGFSAQELVEDVAGPFEETLVYPVSRPSSTISLAVSHAGGEIRYVDREAPSQGWLASAKDTAWFDPCADSLEVEVEIDLVSGDGIWNEHYEATLVSGDRPYIFGTSEQAVALEQIGGTYTPWHLDPETVHETVVSFELEYRHRGPQGRITVYALEPCADGLCRSQFERVAEWPED